MSGEAIEEAIEVLEDASAEMLMETGEENYYGEAITILRQALKTEQEPVLWLKTWPDGSVSVLKTKSNAFADHELEPLYTAPPKQWVGLTDEEIAQGLKESWVTEQAWQSAVWWAEAKLKEKNHG
jgi:hypothetical protein